jgi:hypothetical protein
VALLASAAAITAAAIVAATAGLADFLAYPSVAIEAGPATLALAAALPVAAAAPFLADRWETRRG